MYLMNVRNSNEAKTEKKTRDLGTFVILNQKSVLNYLDEILEKFENDSEYREKLLEKMMPDRKYKNTKKSQDYRMISRILKDDVGLQGVGETTVWRLLRIRKESPELYEKIRENKISIRAAYSELFPENKTKKKETSQSTLTTRGKLDFNKLETELKYIEEELDKIADDESKQPSIKKMKRIDEQLFKIRKKIGRIITENDPEKPF